MLLTWNDLVRCRQHVQSRDVEILDWQIIRDESIHSQAREGLLGESQPSFLQTHQHIKITSSNFHFLTSTFNKIKNYLVGNDGSDQLSHILAIEIPGKSYAVDLDRYSLRYFQGSEENRGCWWWCGSGQWPDQVIKLDIVDCFHLGKKSLKKN